MAAFSKGSFVGFVNGCRPLVRLDGCFLKGKFGGVCLAACALDGNNGMFPIILYIYMDQNQLKPEPTS